MNQMNKIVAIIVPYNPNQDPNMPYEKAKLHGLPSALEKENIRVEEYFYSDEKAKEIENKLENVAMVLVWINPIEYGKNRSILDAMLKRLSQKGIYVSAHPDTILKMGTKEVLFQTKTLDWGCDVDVYRSTADMQKRLPKKLKPSVPRVLKQHRGNGGNGIWRIEISKENPQTKENPYVKVLHATKNSVEEELLLFDYIEKIKDYFLLQGMVIDQEFFSPEPHGMLRCYVSRNKVVGFGHQYVKSLLRPRPGETLESPPRIYHPKDKSEFQDLRTLMEKKWIDQMQIALGLPTKSLPILWDADFLYRGNASSTENKYVLCEINVSSVYPYPETAVTDLVSMIKQILQES